MYGESCLEINQRENRGSHRETGWKDLGTCGRMAGWQAVHNKMRGRASLASTFGALVSIVLFYNFAVPLPLMVPFYRYNRIYIYYIYMCIDLRA